MRKLVFFVSFFLYSGYYAGLAIIFSLNISELSRFYSIPLRIILALIMLYLIIKNRNRLKNNSVSLQITIFIVFWIFYTLKVLYSESNNTGSHLVRPWFEYIFFALTYVVLPFVCFFSLDIKKYKETILSAIIFSGFIMGVFSTYVYGYLLTSGIGRINLAVYETGQDVLSPLALSYAGALTIVLCIFDLVFNKRKPKYKIYLYATIGLSMVMFLLGSSRGSVIALVLTLPLFILYSPLKRKVILFFISILFTPVLGWLIEKSGSNILERLENTSKDKGGGRESLWTDALEHFADYPLFGGRIEIGGIYPHNMFIEILMATGIVGFILIMPIIVGGLRNGISLARINKTNLFFIIIIIQGIVQHTFTAGFYTATLVFTPIAMVFSMQNTLKSEL
jgi:hypothetical protein